MTKDGENYRFDPEVTWAEVMFPWRCWRCNRNVPPGTVYVVRYRGRESSWCPECEAKRRAALDTAYNRITLDPSVGGRNFYTEGGNP